MRASKRTKNVILILFLLISCVFGGKAQENPDNKNIIGIDSSVAYRPVYYLNFSREFPFAVITGEVDTGLCGEQRRESMLSSKNLYAGLGVIGQAHKSLNFQIDEFKNGFNYKTHPFPSYFRDLENWKICLTDQVYTNLHYEWRNGRENSFDIEHAQKIGNFTYNLAFQTRLCIDGIYVNQDVRDINLGFQGHYFSDSMRYGFDITYIFNMFHLHENGGILNVEDYISDMDPRAIKVNTPNALSKLNDNDFRYGQYLRLGHRNKDKTFNSKHGNFIFHEFKSKTLKHHYENPATCTDTNTLIPSSISLMDSIKGFQIQNRLMWTNLSPFSIPDSGIAFAAGISHEYISFADTAKKFNDQILNAEAYLKITFGKFGTLTNKGKYTFAGYGNGDIGLQSIYVFPYKFSHKKERKGFVSADFNYNNREAEFFVYHYSSDPGEWKHGIRFKKEESMSLSATLNFMGYRMTARAFNLKHLIILTENLTFKQLSKDVEILQGELFVPFRIKDFGMNLCLYAQTSDNDSVHMPAFSTRGDIFYGIPLFHQAMYLQIGAEILYFSKFYADAYNSRLQHFYCQNEFVAGGDFYIDAFVNVKIQNFHVSFSAVNILTAFEGYYPFQIPYYPAKKFGFRLALAWRFYN